MIEETREHVEPVDRTAEWENPFVPAPLGDTVVMEFNYERRGDDAVPQPRLGRAGVIRASK